MKTRILAAAVLSIFVFVAGAPAVEPIEGAFGKKFGEKFSSRVSEIQQGTRGPLRTASFTPEKPYPGLDVYSVSVTPVSHRVFEITASGTLLSVDAVKALLSMLEDKFGPFTTENRRDGNALAYANRAGGKIVQLTVRNGNQVVLTFRDGALTAAAREEGAVGKAAEPRPSP